MIALYKGNALRVMDRLEPGTFDAVITDPPYSSGGSSIRETSKSPSEKYTNTKRTCPYPEFEGENMDQRCWIGFIAETLEKARRLCASGAVCALFTDWRQYPSATDALQCAGWTWRGVVIWDKVNSRPQRGRFKQQAEFVVWGSNGKLPIERPVPVLPGVFAHTIEQSARRLHMTQKPLGLMRNLVKICVPGGRILDPFASSGTTLEAARLEGYGAVGIEINDVIAETAARRLGVELELVMTTG